jgi:hypothetical protein
MGGRVWAAQRDDIGAEFVVELPAYEDPTMPAEEVDPEPQEPVLRRDRRARTVGSAPGSVGR